MKIKLLFILLSIFLFVSCHKEEDTYIVPLQKINACGAADPLNDLNWLHEKIINGRDPKYIEFIEYIWIKQFEGKDIIIVEYGLTGYMYHSYDCSGNTVIINDINFYNSLSDNNLIYKYPMMP